MELVVADVHGGHARRAVLEQAVREAARRRADVEAVEPADDEGAVVDGPLELLAAAADESRLGGEGYLGVVGEGVAGLGGGLSVDEDLPREDEALRQFARLREAARHDELV